MISVTTIGGLRERNYSANKLITTQINNRISNNQNANKIVADFIGISRPQQQQQQQQQPLLSSFLLSTSSFILTSFLSFSQLFNLFYRHRKAFRRKNSDASPLQHIQQPFSLHLSLSLSLNLNYCTDVGRQPFSLVERIGAAHS